jgi:HK97 family phage major capsid protein
VLYSTAKPLKRVGLPRQITEEDMTIAELLQKKGELANQAEQILTGARSAGRLDLSGEEEVKFDAIHADIEKLTGTIRRLEKQEALSAGEGRKTEANETRGNGRIAPVARPNYGEAFRSWAMAASKSTEITPEERANAARCGFDLNSNEMTLRLPNKGMRNLSPEGIREWEENRAQSLSATEGGNVVADDLMREIEKARLAYGGMFRVAQVIRTATGATLPWPTANDTSQKGARLAINIQASAQDVVFGQMTLGAFKYSSKLILVPEELMQDSSINLAEFLGQALGERIMRIVNEETTTGAGTTLPWGIATRATAFSGGTGSVGSFGNTALGVTSGGQYQNLVAFEHSVDPEYRANGTFMFHDTTLLKLKQLVDGELRPLWVPGLSTNAPDRFLGYPYVINQDMSATYLTGTKSIVFGDLSKYKIREVRDIQVLRLVERYADYHQVGFLAFARYDGDLLNAGTAPVKAFSHLT